MLISHSVAISSRLFPSISPQIAVYRRVDWGSGAACISGVAWTSGTAWPVDADWGAIVSGAFLSLFTLDFDIS